MKTKDTFELPHFLEMDEYMKTLNLKGTKSENTIIAYVGSLKRFCAYFDIKSSIDVDNITPKQYREFQGHLQETGLSNNSVNAHFRNISAFVKWLLNNEYIENDFLSKVKSLKVAKKESFFMTKEEAQKMVDATGKDIQNRLMLILMFQVGLRRSEVSGIKMEDISGCNILIHGKGDKHIEFPLSKEVCDLLNKYISKVRRPEAEYLFHGKAENENGRLTGKSIDYRVKKFGRLSGMEEGRLNRLTAHSTRRFFGTTAYEKHGLLMASKMLRHASMNTTLLYVKVSDASIKNALLGQESFGEMENSEND